MNQKLLTFEQAENKKRLIAENLENADIIRVYWPEETKLLELRSVNINWTPADHHDKFLSLVCVGQGLDFTEDQVENAAVEGNKITFLPYTEAQIHVYLFTLTPHKVII